MNIIQRLLVVTAFLTILVISIAFARGYRLDMQKKSLTPTGILAISSSPKAAKIYINNELQGATDTNLTLPPGNYQVEVKKEGYTDWTKQVSLKGELVLTIDALLLPLNPSLSPLTNLGIVKAVPLDQTDQILLFTQGGDETKDGIYLFDASVKPLSFMTPLKLILLKKNLPPDVDFIPKAVYFSPDYQQVILEFGQSSTKTVTYLLSLGGENTNLFDVTASEQTLLTAWDKQKQADNQKIIETFPTNIVKIASDSFHIISFSPSETKILYEATQPVTLPPIINPPLIATNQTKEERTLKKSHLYVYDMKEDKNYEINIPVSSPNSSSPTLSPLLPTSYSIMWYPDSRHLIFFDGKKISIVDYDDTNEQTVYSGPFEKSFFTVTSNGTLVILTNLNPEENKLPDLYAVGIH